MRNKFHKSLTQERWSSFSKKDQILNIGAELQRAKYWLERKERKEVENCLDRAFELLDLTLNDVKWKKRELFLLREALADFYSKKEKNNKELVNIFRALLNFSKSTSFVEIA